MNEIIKAIKERRSIRKFKSDMVPQEIIDEIIDAGLYAASGYGKQKSIIIEVTNKEFIKKLSEVNRKIAGWPEGMDPFYGAPVVLIVLDEKDWPTSGNDGSLVIGNMMLAAHTLGIGSCWIHRAKEEFEMPEYKELLKQLGVDGYWVGVGHCAIGYSDMPEQHPHPRRENRIYYIK